jgi:hypothetical protein
VTIEKGQAVQVASGYAEDKIVSVLKRVKEVDPNISTIFYYNSILDWPFYRMHEEFLKHEEWWVKDNKGKTCRMSGDGTFPNHTNMLSFDFTQAAARDFWASECVNMTKTGFVDGCFSDRAAPTNDPHCTLPNKTAFEAAHTQVHQELQKAIGNGPLIANHAYNMEGVNAVQIEGFKADEASIQTLINCVANGKITEAHAGYGVGELEHYPLSSRRYLSCSAPHRSTSSGMTPLPPLTMRCRCCRWR